MLVNFNSDLPQIKGFIVSRVRQQAAVNEPISAIEFSFRLSQSCLIFLHFDARELHENDGEQWSAANEPTLEIKHWNEAFEVANNEGISFVLPSGETHSLSSEAADEEKAVAAIFGDALRTIALNAAVEGVFNSLPLRPDCQLDMEEFDGMWSWPAVYEDLGRTNILSQLLSAKEG